MHVTPVVQCLVNSKCSISVSILSHSSGQLLLLSPTSQTGVKRKHITTFNSFISVNGTTSVPVSES